MEIPQVFEFPFFSSSFLFVYIAPTTLHLISQQYAVIFAQTAVVRVRAGPRRDLAGFTCAGTSKSCSTQSEETFLKSKVFLLRLIKEIIEDVIRTADHSGTLSRARQPTIHRANSSLPTGLRQNNTGADQDNKWKGGCGGAQLDRFCGKVEGASRSTSTPTPPIRPACCGGGVYCWRSELFCQ